jgi:small-conductance mechanosensitive channel
MNKRKKIYSWMVRCSFVLGVILLINVWLLLFSHCLTFASTPKNDEMAVANAENDKTESVSLPENYTTEQIESILARLGDDQVRRLLIKELQKSASGLKTDSRSGQDSESLPGFIQQMGYRAGLAQVRMMEVLSNIKNMPADILKALQKLIGRKGTFRVIGLLVVLAIFGVAFGAEFLFKRFYADFQRKAKSIPLGGSLKFWSAGLKFLPELLGIIIFALTSIVLFLPFYSISSHSLRLVFVDFLIVIVISRLVTSLSRMVCSPDESELRMIPLSDQDSDYLHRNIVVLTWIAVFGIIISGLLYRLQIELDSYITLMIVLGTVVILFVAGIVWKNRISVAQTIIGNGSADSEGRAWFKEQLAAVWHILVLFYLFFIWIAMLGRLVLASGPQLDGAFIISILIVPIFLAVDHIAQKLISSTVGAVSSSKSGSLDKGASQAENSEKNQEKLDLQKKLESEEKMHEEQYLPIARKITRIIIIFVLAFWLLSLWGVDVLFGKALASAAFEVVVILALAHITWGFTINLIDRKLQESEPIAGESDPQEESEWGGAVLDRSQTVLPVFRKFLGSVLVIMVTMIVLSSIGVNIAPLLAGAGVIGLAIGFGAQKLVSDIFSGVFYLIDDSFRMGEYLMAGSLKGSVEKITLRNLWLRHHRGMLQIIPFSDLGAITNYMRGGIVVKFNLEFPYDADIDKIRKIVKKVGIVMLEDEEHGPNFIGQVKSQGVRDISNSVMTIRVKFTAQPGTQFLIRRLAYKQITEALAKAGINYAHRKVIVDVGQPEPPKDQSSDVPSEETQGNSKSSDMDLNQTLIAGGAAALATIVDEEKKEEQKQKK